MRSVEQLIRRGSEAFLSRPLDEERQRNLVALADDFRRIALDDGHGLSARADNAYNAVRAVTNVVVGRLGYQIMSAQGHHRDPLEACCAELGLSQGQHDRLEALMDLRNNNYKGILGNKDAEAAIAEMELFMEAFSGWLKRKPSARSSPR
ncbi:MAG: hypothetical protein ABI766_15220 [Gemmatimonadales bacterium]